METLTLDLQDRFELPALLGVLCALILVHAVAAVIWFKAHVVARATLRTERQIRVGSVITFVIAFPFFLATADDLRGVASVDVRPDGTWILRDRFGIERRTLAPGTVRSFTLSGSFTYAPRSFRRISLIRLAIITPDWKTETIAINERTMRGALERLGYLSPPLPRTGEKTQIPDHNYLQGRPNSEIGRGFVERQ